MRTRFIKISDDIIIMEIKTEDSYEYYLRVPNYPFEYGFGVNLENRMSKPKLEELLDLGWFDHLFD